MLSESGAAPQTYIDAAEEFFAAGPLQGAGWEPTAEAFTGAPPEIDTRVALNILVPDPADTQAVFNTSNGYVFSYLSQRWGHCVDAAVVTDTLAGVYGHAARDALLWVCAHPLDTYARLPISATHSHAAALEPLWDQIVGRDPHVGTTYSAADAAPGVAGALGALARRIDAAVTAAGGTPTTWAAICNLTDGFDGTVTELVEVAAAVTA